MQEILFTISLYKPDMDNSGKWRIDAITREVSWTRKKKIRSYVLFREDTRNLHMMRILYLKS